MKNPVNFEGNLSFI